MADENRKVVEEFWSSDSFISLNRKMLGLFKGDSSVVLLMGELISSSKYFHDLTGEDWFFKTVESLEESIFMSKYAQRINFGILEENNFLETCRRGVPPKRYIKINYGTIRKAMTAGALPSRKATPKVTKAKTKAEFYLELNEAMSGSYDTARLCFGNIPEAIGKFVYAWSVAFAKGGRGAWRWDSPSYGTLAKYWKETYGVYKEFDYNVLLSYMSDPAEERKHIAGLIDLDSSMPEQYPSHKLTFEDYLDILHEGGLNGKEL